MKYPPKTENELSERLYNIAGLTLAELAHSIDWNVPDDLMHNKGWIGQLLEAVLVTSARNLSEPDFLELGIELKSIPVKTCNNYPVETTYVCVVPLTDNLGLQWHNSCVAKKLKRVVWLPIETGPGIILAERKVGQGYIWSPSLETQSILQSDWEELMEYVALGEIDQIDASYGEYLQIRPKAANAKARTQSIGQSGVYTTTLPRGFYLRKEFTHKVLTREL